MFTAFEELPVTRQWELVTSSRGLAGVHGQGLTWAAMLPSDATRCAVLEILPATMRNTGSVYDYVRWSTANNVKLYRLTEAVSQGCAKEYWRTCGNVSLSIPRVEREMEKLLEYVKTSGAL